MRRACYACVNRIRKAKHPRDGKTIRGSRERITPRRCGGAVVRMARETGHAPWVSRKSMVTPVASGMISSYPGVRLPATCIPIIMVGGAVWRTPRRLLETARRRISQGPPWRHFQITTSQQPSSHEPLPLAHRSLSRCRSTLPQPFSVMPFREEFAIRGTFSPPR